LHVQKFSDRIIVDENYFRFIVPQGLSEIGLEEWVMPLI
jgi:hypothetical protein